MTMDWSDRHRRLRRLMLASALITLVLARLSQLAGDDWPGEDFRPYLAEGVAYGLMIFIYLFVCFVVRTASESKDVSNFTKRLGRILSRIALARQHTEQLYRGLDGAMMSRRLAVWDSVLREGGPSLLATKRSAMAEIAERLDRLRQSVDKAVRLQSAQLAGSEFAGQSAPEPQSNILSEAKGALRQMDVAAKQLDDQIRALELALTETRQAIADTRHLFSNSERTGADDINRNLMIAAENLRNLYKKVMHQHWRQHVDHFLFGVYLPSLVALALVILSLPAAFEGIRAFRSFLVETLTSLWQLLGLAF